MKKSDPDRAARLAAIPRWSAKDIEKAIRRIQKRAGGGKITITYVRTPW